MIPLKVVVIRESFSEIILELPRSLTHLFSISRKLLIIVRGFVARIILASRGALHPVSFVLGIRSEILLVLVAAVVPLFVVVRLGLWRSVIFVRFVMLVGMHLFLKKFD